VDSEDKEAILRELGLWDEYAPHIDSIDIAVLPYDEYICAKALKEIHAGLGRPEYLALEEAIIDFCDTAILLRKSL
jgi:hypothetical protein